MGFVVGGVIYLTFAWTVVQLTTSTDDGNSKVTDLTARTMAHTAGRRHGLIGRLGIGIGSYRIAKVVTNYVDDELECAR